MPPSACLSAEDIERYAAGETDDGSIAPHLAACEACRRACDRLRENNALLAEMARAVRAGAAVAPRFAASIPGYRILEDIGAGGQGVVYKAVQLATKRIVALKVLLGGNFAEPRRRERFEREIELVASLNHPSIVTIFDSGATPDGRRYFAMEYVAGKPLLDYVRGEPPRRRASRLRPQHQPTEPPATETTRDRPPPAAAAIALRDRLILFARICDALSAPHLRGIVHRDLKPANLLIDASGAPHILDFGLAKVLGDDPLSDGATPTISGEFMGTFAYAAPEQLRGRPELIDIRTDVYALGVVLYELLTERPPYKLGESIGDAIRTITEAEPPRPSAVHAGLDDELDTIALKALAKEPARRYQSAGDLARDVQRYLAGEPIDAKRDSTWYVLRKAARKHRTLFVAGATALVFLLVFAVSMAMLARRVELQRQRADESARGLAQTLTQANIERGRLMTETGNIVLAERLLWREFLMQPADSPASRQAYWALWELYSRQPCLATLATDFQVSVALEWSAATQIFAADRMGRIDNWDISALQRTATIQLDGWNGQLGQPEFSADAALAFVYDQDHLLLWELPSGRLRVRIPAHPSRPGLLVPAAFTADGRYLACPLDGERLALCDTHDGRVVAHSDPAPELVRDLLRIVPTSDGARAITITRSNRAALWDVQSGKYARVWESSFPVGNTAVALAPDSRSLVVCGEVAGYGFRRLGIDSDLPVCEATWNGGLANHIVFSPDGSHIAASTADRIIRLWDATDCRLLHALVGNSAVASSLRFHPSGRVLASGAADGTIKLWDVRPTATVRFAPGQITVTALAFSPDGEELLTGFDDPGQLTTHNPRTGARIRAYPGSARPISGVAWTPDGQSVAATGHDGAIRIFDRRTTQEVCTLRHPDEKRAHELALHPGGRLIASGHDDGLVRLWDLQERACIAEFAGQRGRVPSLRFSPDGQMLAAASVDGRVLIWDTATRSVLHELPASATVERAVAFSPDSRTLVSGGDDGALKLWDTGTGERRATLEAHQHDVFTVACSPDGRLIASGDRGGVIMLWDAATGRNLAKLTHHTDMVFGVGFSPDSRYLASGSRDATAVVLDLTYFEQHVGGNLEFQLSRLESSGDGLDPAVGVERRAWARAAWQRASHFFGLDR